jgi:peptide deformylase
VVEAVDDNIIRLIDDMLETMYAAPGVGLAATQVNVHKRLLVIDVSDTKDAPLCLINPEIVAEDGAEFSAEGCLSVPDVTESVERAQRITVRGLDRNEKPIEIIAEGLLSVCIQHEMDHLEGKLFVDYLSELKRQRIKKKLSKLRRRDPSGPVARSAPIF